MPKIVRHPTVESVLKFLKPNPNLRGTQYEIAKEIESTTLFMLDRVKDSPEFVAGLRKLLEAKDAFVRASLDL